MATGKTVDRSFLCDWTKIDSSNLSLSDKQYTPILEPRTGRFVGLFIGQPDGVYRCWTKKSITDVDALLKEAGFTKVPPANDWSFLCDWTKADSSNLSLSDKQYTPIIEPRTGRFVGLFFGEPGGVYRCWAKKSISDVDALLKEAGFTKVPPAKCGLAFRG